MQAGIYWGGRDAVLAVDHIVAAEAAGVAMAWHGHGLAFPDPLTFLAAAAARTERIGLGTAIARVDNRLAAVVATQADAIQQLAGGRFRLGLGYDFYRTERPLAYMRAFISDLRTRPAMEAMPVILAAKGPKAFALAGELADGAMTWLTEPSYVAAVGRPSLRAAADAAGRPAPPVVLHMNVCLVPDEVTAATLLRSHPGRRLLGAWDWTDQQVRDLTAWGSDDEIAARLGAALALSGADELLLRPWFCDENDDEETGRFLRLTAGLASLPG